MKNFKKNYFIIPAAALLVGLLRQYISATNRAWFVSLHTPLFMPSFQSLNYILWPFMHLSTMLSVLFIWNKSKKELRYTLILPLLIILFFLHIAWSITFFHFHNIKLSFLIKLGYSGLSFNLIKNILKKFPHITFIFIPFLIWESASIFINYKLISLNF